MVRTQAAFHSALLMCVSWSQKPMQSASDLPPPPGVLGADSLGLAAGEALGDSAKLGCVTPPVANCVGSCGERGAMGASSGSGAAIADGGVSRSGGGGGGEVSNFPKMIERLQPPRQQPRSIRFGCAGGAIGGLGRASHRRRRDGGGSRRMHRTDGMGLNPTGSPETGCAPGRPTPGEGVVAICEAGAIGGRRLPHVRPLEHQLHRTSALGSKAADIANGQFVRKAFM